VWFAAGHNFVGTEQILLGLIGESTGIAAKVLKSMGVNLKVSTPCTFALLNKFGPVCSGRSHISAAN
jgi:ATP-dependent Clp protease ATP-binding subunit ClpA